jgi:hypothetical protein
LRIAFVGHEISRVIAITDQPPNETRRGFGMGIDWIKRVHEVSIGWVAALVKEASDINLGKMVPVHAKASAISLREFSTP